MIAEWNVFVAINEVQAFSDLIDEWGEETGRREGCKQRRSGLISTQAIMSSYAFEIAIKTLVWIDNPHEGVEATHDLLKLYRELKEDTKARLEKIGVTYQSLSKDHSPFVKNRYPMEIRYDQKCRDECRKRCKEECKEYYSKQHPEDYKNHKKAECKKECKNQCKDGCKVDFVKVVYRPEHLRDLVKLIEEKMATAELLVAPGLTIRRHSPKK